MGTSSRRTEPQIDRGRLEQVRALVLEQESPGNMRIWDLLGRAGIGWDWLELVGRCLDGFEKLRIVARLYIS